MGFALPAAIGAALARPGLPVICMAGDGGLGMTLAELETVARLGLPITVVVFNDAALSLIEIKQTAGQGDERAVRYGLVDFAGVAAAMGIDAFVAETAGDVDRAVEAGWNRPRLIDARIDPTPYGGLIKATRG
jgi:acetolactate synthase-1/2/3 large subunit